MKRQSGFTIIELMISLVILSFIALGIYNNTSQSFILRDNVEQDGDFYNSIRVSIDVLGRDVQQMYSPQTSALPGDIGQAGGPSGASGAPGFVQGQQQQSFGTDSYYWSEPINANGVRASRFQGDATKISFIINSHMRLFRDTPESDFAKIMYTLEDEKNPMPGQSGKVLVKYEDPVAFDEKDKSDQMARYELITNVKSLEFKYLDSEKDTWYNKWDTAEGVDHKGVFPAVIEINLEIFSPAAAKQEVSATEKSAFKVIERFRPELPL